MDDFFKKTNCDRCKKDLRSGLRTMSMYNTDCICENCKAEERKRPDYKEASQKELEEVKKGNYNYKGIGLK